MAVVGIEQVAIAGLAAFVDILAKEWQANGGGPLARSRSTAVRGAVGSAAAAHRHYMARATANRRWPACFRSPAARGTAGFAVVGDTPSHCMAQVIGTVQADSQACFRWPAAGAHVTDMIGEIAQSLGKG